jgi:hypothetical protein
MKAFVRKHQCDLETLRLKLEGLEHNAEHAPSLGQRQQFLRMVVEFNNTCAILGIEL